MRLSFIVNDKTPHGISLTVMAADDATAGMLAVSYRTDKTGGYHFDGIAITHNAKGVLDGCEHLILRSVQQQAYTTPLQLARGILERRGCQVVFDPRVKKYQSVGKIVKGSSLWYALGIEHVDGKPQFQVQSVDEVTAKALLTKAVVAAMQEHPARAAKLAGFFECGSKVEEVTSDEAPDYVPYSALANVDEAALAVAPIKLRTRDDKDA